MDNTYLTEAFKKLNSLNEEVFDVDEEGLDDFEELTSEEDNTIDIIDPEAEEEVEDSYLDKVVLDCCVCHSKIYKDADSVVIDETGEMANVGEECPYCYSVDGYKIIGQIVPYEEDPELKVEVEDKVDDDVDAEIPEEVKESFLRRKRARIVRECKNTKKFKKSIRLKEEDEIDTIEDKIEEVVAELSDEAIEDLTTQMIADYIVDNIDRIDNEEVQEVIDEINETAEEFETDDEVVDDVPVDDEISDVEELEDASTKLMGESYKRLQEKASVAIKNVAIDAPQVIYGIEQYAEYLSNYMQNEKYAAHFGYPDRLAKEVAELAKAAAKFTSQDRKTGFNTPNSSKYFDHKLFKQPKALAEIISELGTALGNSVETVIADIPDPRAKNNRNFTLELRKLLQLIANGAKSVAVDLGHIKKGETKGLFNKKFKESFESVELETEDKVIKVSEEEKDEEPDGEMIEPLDLDTETDIVDATNDENAEDMEFEDEGSEEGSEDEFVDQDFEEFDEEEFDDLGESYLKKVYDNVKSFKTSKVSTKGNTLKLEGVIKFDSGNTKATTFLFEAKDITKRGKVRFIGENKQITRGKKSFTLTGSVKGKKLIAESLNYNYRTKGADGKSVRLYGTVKRK